MPPVLHQCKELSRMLCRQISATVDHISCLDLRRAADEGVVASGTGQVVHTGSERNRFICSLCSLYIYKKTGPPYGGLYRTSAAFSQISMRE